MADFDQAVKVVLAHEGGFVNNPADPGGITNYGITLRFLVDHPDFDVNGDGKIDARDIKAMTATAAAAIYKQEWWDKYKYSDIRDQTLATKVFDYAVNMGASQAHKLLQRTINSFFGMALKDDGVIGPVTLSIINRFDADAALEAKFIQAYSDTVWAFYQSLIKNKPSLSVFAKGWKNRAYSVGPVLQKGVK